MKGIILAGGNGTRLLPLTKVINKAMLPVGGKPAIYHCIEKFTSSGVNDILVVCGGNNAGQFLELLGNGEQFGLKNLNYVYQPEPLGIAHALSLAENWAEQMPIAVMLSDNMFEDDFADEFKIFEANPHVAKIFLTEVENPEHYGVVELHGNQVKSIEEKPDNPKSNYIATGLYLYGSSVWAKIKGLSPSDRNELEITDLNNMYLKDNILQAVKLKGYWFDIGENIEGYRRACNLIK